MSKTKRNNELSAKEVGQIFGKNSRTIRRWIEAGHFPNARKSGPFQRSHYTIPVSDVEALKKKLELV